MIAADLAPSPALLEANRRLHKLREQVQAGKARTVDLEQLVPTGRPLAASGRQEGRAAGSRASIAHLPKHLGWESAAFTAALRAAQKHGHEAKGDAGSTDLAWLAETRAIDEPAPVSSSQRPAADTVKLYPDIALGILQQEVAAAGRIWLLLRHLDQAGQGWLRLDLVQEKLTAKNSVLRVCGRRHLRSLLKQGRGVFWERDQAPGSEARVWLMSAAKVAAALGVERLRGRPVELPVQVLLDSIGRVRAHLYASFHSGRRSGNPISRATLEKVTHVPARTQRVYDKAAGVASRRNLAVGNPYSQKEVQERAWRHGRAAFEFIDERGRQGPAGRRYVAWRLPNSYEGCHQPSPKGRQRKINQQIDLVIKVAQGNGLGRGASRPEFGRLFHANGLEAGNAYNRAPSVDIYWERADLRADLPTPAATMVWYVLPAQE